MIIQNKISSLNLGVRPKKSCRQHKGYDVIWVHFCNAFAKDSWSLRKFARHFCFIGTVSNNCRNQCFGSKFIASGSGKKSEYGSGSQLFLNNAWIKELMENCFRIIRFPRQKKSIERYSYTVRYCLKSNIIL